MSQEKLAEYKAAYWKLIEAMHELPNEYHKAMEIALDVLEKEIEKEAK